MYDKVKLSETTVEDILKSTPRAARFFFDWQTSCAGCIFSRFCTLKDVVNIYQFDEKKFLEAIGKLTSQKSL